MDASMTLEERMIKRLTEKACWYRGWRLKGKEKSEKAWRGVRGGEG